MLINAAKIEKISFTYEKVNKTDSLQPSSYNEPLVSLKANDGQVILTLVQFYVHKI